MSVVAIHNPFKSKLFYLKSLDGSISNRRDARLMFICPRPKCFVEIPVSVANSVDPDQTPLSVASVMDLHCLPMSILWNAMLK